MSLVQETMEKKRRNRVADNREEIAQIKEQLMKRCQELCREGRLKEALLYGSVLKPEFFHSNSDIDLAIGGIEPSDCWAVAGYLGRDLARQVDVQFIEDLPPERADKVRKQGISLL